MDLDKGGGFISHRLVRVFIMRIYFISRVRLLPIVYPSVVSYLSSNKALV